MSCSKNTKQILRCTQCGWILDVRAYAKVPVCECGKKGNIQHPTISDTSKIDFCVTCPSCGVTYKGEMPIT